MSSSKHPTAPAAAPKKRPAPAVLPAIPAHDRRSNPRAERRAGGKPGNHGKALSTLQRRAVDNPTDAKTDEGLEIARADAVKYLHSRRQAVFALARQYHLDSEDLQQEAYEVLLTCLRDYTPTHTRADGTTVNVLFNTFFGTRLEGKGLEMRNRDPEYQARQAHLQDLSDEQKIEFRQNPPLLVQHLDQETAMQEQLRGEAAGAAQSGRTPIGQRLLQDSLIEKKLSELIAAERDDKRRAALLHVKVGGVASFEEIAYHFGVTDSRASQILNDLMDAFYVQRLLDGDLKSIAYDFKKLKLQEKRALRLLEDALRHALPARAEEIAHSFAGDYPTIVELQRKIALSPAASASAAAAIRPSATSETRSENANQPFINGVDALTPGELQQYPLQGLEWRPLSALAPVTISFRPPAQETEKNHPHVARVLAANPTGWSEQSPLLVTDKGQIIDGQRRYALAVEQGEQKVFCQVIAVPDDYVATVLRVALNLRSIRPDKPDLYWAIAVLLERGLSQQKISQLLGTSRPNVIVYAKVREKASQPLRQLFEDGLIQITNASSAVDLGEKAQAELATFIRNHGADWGRGPRFSEVFEAAAGGTLERLAARSANLPHRGFPDTPEDETVGQTGLHLAGGMGYAAYPPQTVGEAPVNPPLSADIAVANGSHTGTSLAINPTAVEALRRRQQTLENTLRDNEVWARQREATVTQQTQQIIDLKSQVENMARELQAARLLPHSDAATRENHLKQTKTYAALIERLAGVSHSLVSAAKQIRTMPLGSIQITELNDVADTMASHLNALRTELVSRRRTPSR